MVEQKNYVTQQSNQKRSSQIVTIHENLNKHQIIIEEKTER